MSENKSDKRIIFSAFTALAAFIIYLLTVAPDLMFTDSGELAAVCSSLGVAHPTGYPLFTILGYLWPLGGISGLNIFAAFLTALSAGIFSYTASMIIPVDQKDIRNPLIAMSAGLVYAFGLTIWQQATSLEVYSLQVLMVNLIIMLLIMAMKSNANSTKFLFAAALAIGLGFSNHMTTLFTLPMAFFLYFRMPGGKWDFSARRFKMLLWLIVPFAIGLSFYLYLPIRSAGGAEFNWGEVSRSWDKFIYHVSGKQYQVWMFSDSAVIKENLVKFFGLVPYQLGFIGLAPFLWGLWSLFRSNRDIFWALIILIISCVAYAVNYSIHDIESYFATALIGITLITAVGMAGMVKKSKALLVPVLLLPMAGLGLNYSECDLSEDYTVTAFTEMVCGELDDNALVISSQWDFWCSAFWYKQRIEGYRQDVVLVEKELLRRTWYPRQLQRWYPEATARSKEKIAAYMNELEIFESGKQYNPAVIQHNFIAMINSFIDSNIDTRPVYITLDVLQTDPDIAKAYMKIPDGFAFRLVKEQKQHEVDVDNIDISKFVQSVSGRQGHLYNGIKNAATVSLVNLGRYAMATGQTARARTALSKAAEIDPENKVLKNALMQFNQNLSSD